MDAVQFEPSRVCSIGMLYFAMFLVITYDARAYTKAKTSIAGYLFGFACVCSWGILILFWTGIWQNVRQTVIPVIDGVLEFNIPSVGLSFFATFCILLTRYVWVLGFSTEVNQLVVVRAPVSYRYRAPDTIEAAGGGGVIEVMADPA
jgi:hypothetical protein